MDSKAKKGKGKTSHSKFETSKARKKQDFSKVKCLNCHEHGNYATNYLQNKNNKKATRGAVGEALASQFELEFTLIACMVS